MKNCHEKIEESIQQRGKVWTYINKLQKLLGNNVIKQERGDLAFGLVKSRTFQFPVNKQIKNTAGLPMSYKLGPRWNTIITRPDFKSDAIFGFLSPNYTGQCT